MRNDRRQFLKTTAAASVLGVSQPAQLLAAAGAPMPQHELGTTGAMLPILQLGTAQRLDPTYDKIMHRCFRDGVTAFDTALSYGWGASHQAVANFIEQMGDRNKLWLTSKSGKRAPRGFIADIDQALAELKTDHLDLYLMHGINDLDMLRPDFIAAGERLRQSGKTRFFGFSCHGGNVVELMNKAAEIGSDGINAILFRYNFRRYGDRELNLAIDNCNRAGIGLLAMKTMGGVAPEVEQVAQFRSQNFTLAQAKLKSVWADQRIDSIVSEMDSVRVARENIQAAKAKTPLAAEELHQLNQLAAMTAGYACHGCSHLCEKTLTGGTAIADQLRYLSYAESYNKPDRARELYRALPFAARQFDTKALQQAAKICPQGIDIAARLTQAQRVLGA